MFKGILHFDWIFFAKKKSFLLLLLFFLGFGVFTAVGANFPFPETYKNSPYVITYITGIMSLMSLFTVSLLTAQSLMREKEAHFDLILYATPLQKKYYLGSRFLVICGIAVILFALYCIGLLIGYQFFRSHRDEFMELHLWHYIQPFLLLAVPNILFCTGVICSIGVLVKNRIAIYISGLFIYFFYWGIAMFSNSPLMANASPISAESMQLMAKLDPFGLSAFFEQTQYWTAEQRNSQLLELKGSFLLNRMVWLAISFLLMFYAYRKLSFVAGNEKKSRNRTQEKKSDFQGDYHPVATKSSGCAYSFKAFFSFVKIDLRSIVKSVPIWIIILGWCSFVCIELIGMIDAGRRLPERFATTALMANEIMKLFPIVGILILIFYGSEVFWRSQSARFESLENSSPVPTAIVVLSKWFSLAVITVLLLLCNCLLGVILQLSFGSASIDFGLYLSLFYLIGLPLLLCSALIISIQSICRNRYVGLAVATILLLFTNTSLGGMVGIKHPVLQYANVFQGAYSEMNGFDFFLDAFHIKMIYWTCVTALIFLVAIWFNSKKMAVGKLKILPFIMLFTFLGGAAFSGTLLLKEIEQSKNNERNDWKQTYEERYKKFSQLLQPSITDIKTNIDLFPEGNNYTVLGSYTLENKGDKAIDSILVYADKELEWEKIEINGAKLVVEDKHYGHYWYKLLLPLQPGESGTMKFGFAYKASPFNGFKQFNAILKNGSFIRISNFFPRLGYIGDNEIDDPKERTRRNMPASSIVVPLEEKIQMPYYYDHVNLDAVISTSGNQTAIGIGDLKAQWKKDGRNYFQYKTPSPIPFRFAVSSARYAVQKVMYNGIAIEVYYHPEHKQNIDHIVRNAKQTLRYCEQNFSNYPYNVIRFAEISSYVKGFAATAYPTSYFINESFGFQNKIKQDPEKDILNELISHELSHTWWGNATIDTDYRQGSKMLTETLAMYTELMLYRTVYGNENILSRVRVHKDIYLGERAFWGEEPLYKSDPNKPFLCYDKGMVAMYQLEMLLGEEKINKALRSLLQKHAYPLRPPTSLDLINEFYAVSDRALHPKIDELFKQIIIHDLQLDTAVVTKTKEGKYELNVAVIAKKYSEDDKGESTKIAFDDSIEVEIYFENGKKQIITMEKNQLQLKMLLSQKPAKIILDPRMRFMEISLEDNGKNL